MKHTLHSTITPVELKAGCTPEPGWYITRDQQNLINIDKDCWITCYATVAAAQPIRLADGNQGTPRPEDLNRTIGNQHAYRLTDIDISAEPLYEETCDED